MSSIVYKSVVYLIEMDNLSDLDSEWSAIYAFIDKEDAIKRITELRRVSPESIEYRMIRHKIVDKIIDHV